MSSAGHCGRHDIYRCNDCGKNHKDSYHSDLNDLDKRIAELEAERDNWRTRHLEIARDYDKLRHLAHAVTNRLCWTDSTDTAPFSDYDEVNILKEYLDELMRAT
jgi:hypothetical protein